MNHKLTIFESFSSGYKEARTKFLAAAKQAGASMASQPHPLKGADGEDLAMDLALIGNPDAELLLIVSSACHGVEGYCGSGVQVHSLQDEAWLQAVTESKIAVLYIHALNPHGFSFKRRVTQENVDLNRNFQDFSKSLPMNEGYSAVHPLLLPEVWPPNADNQTATLDYITQHGMAGLQAVVSRGQHTHPDGLFFGGQAPTWSNDTLRQVLRTYGANRKHIAWIDLHTGLGPSGLGERIYAGANSPDDLARARAMWGGGKEGFPETPITSFYDGSSTSAFLTGLMWYSILEECPAAKYTGIAMEYGTEDQLNVMTALRGDHWLHLQDQQGKAVDPALRRAIKVAIFKAFYTDTDVWKQQIVEQAKAAQQQALLGLANL